ncbi:MAG: DUF4260 domain-containing protein [Acidimicrobiia bacterium]
MSMQDFAPKAFGPLVIQRLEGLAILVASLLGFADADLSWWWFAALLLIPDLSMVGYLANPSFGALTYNLGHTLLGPALLFGWYYLGGPLGVLPIAWIWLAHIGLDRVLGYGLKYADAFTHTHLGMIGPSRAQAGG